MIKCIYRISLLFTLLTAPLALLGQTTTWDAGDRTGNITLSGTLRINGIITIPANKTLNITNTSGSSLTIKAIANLEQMFHIKPGGKLIIEGTTTDRNSIIIDGGAIFSGNSPYNTSSFEAVTNTGYKARGIKNENGTLQIKNITIRNCDGTGSDKTRGGALFVCGEQKGETGRTTQIDNCLIRYCTAGEGGAIQASNTNPGGGNSENCKITVNNSTIEYCYSPGGNIRTNGNTVSSLYLNNTIVQYNYSSGSGGGIYWNAAGTAQTTVYFNGCTFQNNRAAIQGGAMMLESNFNFVENGNKTTICNNTAIDFGGGIVITSYGGNAFAVQPNDKYYLVYTFSDKLEISNNSAGIGGGICFNFNKYALNEDFNNEAKNTPNTLVHTTINFNGATITDNKALSGEAGGIRIYNNTHNWENNKRTIQYVVNVNGGTITGNTSINKGAGIYTYMTDISHTSEKTTDLIIQSNKVSNGNGGGIYVEGGKSISLGSVKLISNNAANGGGIYLSSSSGTEFKTSGATLIENNYSSDNGGAVYVTGGKVSLTTPKIAGNGKNGSSTVTKNGGAIYVSGTGSGFTATGTATIQNNASTENGGGIYVNGGNVNMATSNISGNQSKDGGGVYVLNGNFTTTGETNLENNTSTNNGGALFVQGGTTSGTTTLNTPTIKNNSATNNGGAIYSTGTVTSNGKSLISDNSAKNGGAIYTTGSVELNGDLDMTGNKATGNTDSKGGAVYIAGNNSNFTVTGTSSISTNESTFEGGAIFVDGGNVSMGKTTLSGNKSQDGGAIYSSGAVTINGESTIEGNSGANGGAIYTTGAVSLKGNSTMNNNIATGDGGVMYVEGANISSNGFDVIARGNKAVNGGVFRVKGSIELGYTVMENNTASANGGAVALYNGTFSMANNDGKGNSSSIVNNKATDGFGGGLYINSQSQSSITWNGGIFSNNTAKAGGAVAVDGPIDLTFSATMENNIAEIGGGLYLKEATMNFGDGLVRGNKAEQPESNTTQYSTAMYLDASSVSGVGGGIFMANGATLNFTNSQNLGIYNNFATNAGADICANGSNTTLNLPNPNGLNLKGFDVPTDRLDWIEDYFNGESSSNTNNKFVGIRYEKLLQVLKTDNGDDIEDYMIPYDNNESIKSFTNYICVDLGYDLVYVDLTVLGLKNLDHAAIICSYRDKTDDNIKEYRKILFTGNGEDGGVKRIVALPSGDWQFKASDWSYNYNSPAITAGVKGSSSGGSAITGDELIYISNKTEGGAAGGYNAISAMFEPKSNGETSQARVKQFQAEKVNRMVRN